MVIRTQWTVSFIYIGVNSGASVHNGRVVSTRALLWCGAVGGPLFVVVFLIAGAVRPDYDPLRHPVSSLALTEAGWVQEANFLLTGALFVAFGFGLRRALGGI